MNRSSTPLLITLMTVGLTLAACNQQPSPQIATPQSLSRTLEQNAQLVDASPSLPSTAESGLITPEEASAQLQEAHFALLVTGKAPTWAAERLDSQSHLKVGTLHAGVPFALTSPVELTLSETSTAAEDVAALPTLTRDLTRYGDAALVPLLLEDGAAVGLARLPLYAGAKVAPENLEYVLFDQPTEKLMTAQDAAVAAGTPEARVMAVALDGKGSYDPFHFSWAIEAANPEAAPALVTTRTPGFLTQRGDQMPAVESSVSLLDLSATRVSLQSATEAYALYESAAQAKVRQ